MKGKGKSMLRSVLNFVLVLLLSFTLACVVLWFSITAFAAEVQPEDEALVAELAETTAASSESQQLETPEVEWDANHPGKVKWNKVKSASRYEIQLYRINDNGNEKRVYKDTTTSLSYDLCSQMAKSDVFGKAVYVKVMAKGTKNKNVDSEYGETDYFHDADLDWTPRKSHHKDEHWDYDNDVDDNWRLFEMAYYNFHNKTLNYGNSNDDKYWDRNNGNNAGPSNSKYKNGWYQEGYNWYYYKNGSRQSGWVENQTFYCDSTGAMVTGWYKISDKWYYFSPSGRKVMKSWVYSYNGDGKWYYFGSNGAMVTNSWIDNNKYYVKGNGEMAVGWYPVKGNWYWFDSSGNKLKNQWVLTNGNWYYVGKDGAMLENEWITYNDNQYYLQYGGVMATGLCNFGGVWYQFYPANDTRCGIFINSWR